MKKAFINPTKDKSWLTKILIGGLISAIPMGIIITYGYLVLYLHSLLISENKNMPQWTDIRIILKVSLKLLVVVLIYVWPIIIICLFITAPYYSIHHSTSRMIIISSSPMLLFIKFFLNIAYVIFAKSNFQISAIMSIREIFNLIRTHFKKYLVVYLFDVITFLIITLDLMIFIDNRGWIFIFTRFPIATFIFYLYLVINNMLAMVFGKQRQEILETTAPISS